LGKLEGDKTKQSQMDRVVNLNRTSNGSAALLCGLTDAKLSIADEANKLLPI
jgi:hypothetical protein